MAGLIVPVSGPYIGTFGGAANGIQGDDGYKLTGSWKAQEINETDQYGLTLIDYIHRGHDWRCVTRGQDYKAGLLASLQAFGTAPSVAGAILAPALTNIGNDALNGFTSVLVLTRVLGFPPSTPASLTASQCVLAPNNTTELLFTSKLRELPIEWVFLPYTTTISAVQYIVPFTVT